MVIGGFETLMGVGGANSTPVLHPLNPSTPSFSFIENAVLQIHFSAWRLTALGAPEVVSSQVKGKVQATKSATIDPASRASFS
jgi:hypothetical protein